MSGCKDSLIFIATLGFYYVLGREGKIKCASQNDTQEKDLQDTAGEGMSHVPQPSAPVFVKSRGNMVRQENTSLPFIFEDYFYSYKNIEESKSSVTKHMSYFGTTCYLRKTI